MGVQRWTARGHRQPDSNRGIGSEAADTDPGIGPDGHVAIVEAVGPNDSYIVVSQDNWSSDTDKYGWALILADTPGQGQVWPNNFIHFPTTRLPTTLSYTHPGRLIQSTGNLYWTANQTESGVSQSDVFRASKGNVPGQESILYQESQPAASPVDFEAITYANVGGNWYGYFVANYPADAESQVMRVPLSGGTAVVLATSPAVIGARDLVTDELGGRSWRSRPRTPSPPGPWAFSLAGDSMLALSSVGAQTARLIRVDLATGAAEVLAEDPAADVSDVRLNPDTREPQIVTVLKARSEYRVLDPSVARHLDAIRRCIRAIRSSATPTTPTGLAGVLHQRRRARSRSTPTTRRDRRRRASCSSTSRRCRGTSWPRWSPSATSRDGLTVNGYLTFPLGPDRSGLPTVLHVHGGPWARDTWGYDPEAQWLANRGYLCIQVNFRGSTGLRQGFVNAGDREWGASMHDDLSRRGRLRAIREGWTDPARVAIYGGSYGGYAALVGAAFTPDSSGARSTSSGRPT